jgi:hypothetical protein
MNEFEKRGAEMRKESNECKKEINENSSKKRLLLFV